MGTPLKEGAAAEASTPRTGYRWVVLLFAWGALLLSFVDRLAIGMRAFVQDSLFLDTDQRFEVGEVDQFELAIPAARGP